MKTAVFLVLWLATAPVLAEGLPSGVASAHLADGWAAPDGTRISALVVELESGWKTYWRSPGDGGVPPLLDWTGSGNLGAVAIDWPAPAIFDTQGLKTLGYHDRMVLPLRIAVPDASQPVAARLHASLGVCRDICVPVTLDLTAEWAAAASEGADAALIRQALGARPDPGPAPTDCTLSPIKDGMTLTARFDPAPAGTGATTEVAVESLQPGVWASSANIDVQGNALVVTADLVPPEARPFQADRAALRFTLLGQGKALESQGCPASGTESTAKPSN